MEKNIVNFGIKVINIITSYITFQNFIEIYGNILTNIIKIVKISLEFLKSISELLPNILDFKFIFKLAFGLAFYSKIFLTFGPSTYCPVFLDSFAKSYWDTITMMSAGIYLSVKEILLLTNETSELKVLNSQLQEELKKQYENSLPKDLFEEELIRLRERGI